MRALAALMVAAALAPQPGVGQEVDNLRVGLWRAMGTDESLRAWLDGFRPRALAAGIAPATWDAAMADVPFRPDVVDRDRRQDEFTRAIWDYLDRAVSEDRIIFGQRALKENAALLDRVEATYGVDRAVVVAIWGLESAYGAVRGDVPTLSALATLAHDGRRGAFFEAELVAALRILQEGHVKPAAMLGSWAGAMGHTQFMPSSFLRLAVDFDGDGRRNVWGEDPADALASTAAYLAASGWKKGLPWGIEVRLPAGFDYALAGVRTPRPQRYWADLGVTGVAGPLTGQDWGAVLLPAGAEGPAFLIFDNFAAIETYNIADAYVIAVGHLADRLQGGGPIVQDWPRHGRVLTLAERMELQGHLTALGFDTLGADGRIGPRTLAQMKAFQTAEGLVPDGYASPDLLARLRALSGTRR